MTKKDWLITFISVCLGTMVGQLIWATGEIIMRGGH